MTSTNIDLNLCHNLASLDHKELSYIDGHEIIFRITMTDYACPLFALNIFCTHSRILAMFIGLHTSLDKVYVILCVFCACICLPVH